MTQKDKELLLRDLCARLPYHDLWAQYDNKDWLAIGYGHERIELLSSIFSSVTGPCPLIDEIKPYLRSMSSMTEEEEQYVLNTWSEDDLNNGIDLMYDNYMMLGYASDFIDWLNEHHFDYRGLIPMGLALEAKEGMYE